MKLRLKNNSLRLRLTQDEVKRFRESGAVEESIEFGTGNHQRLTYALVASDGDGPAITVFEPHRISVYISATAGREWTDTDRVGIEGEQHVGGDRTLRILVEKDFTCLEPRSGEDDADTFEHPAKSCGDPGNVDR